MLAKQNLPRPRMKVDISRNPDQTEHEDGYCQQLILHNGNPESSDP